MVMIVQEVLMGEVKSRQSPRINPGLLAIVDFSLSPHNIKCVFVSPVETRCYSLLSFTAKLHAKRVCVKAANIPIPYSAKFSRYIIFMVFTNSPQIAKTKLHETFR